MNTVQKYHENPLKISFVFKPGIKSLSTCLPVGIEILPPFSNTVQPLASPQAICRHASGWYNLNTHG